MPELAARVAKEFAQQLEDRAIQRAHPPEGEVSVGDEPWECVLCGAESATNEVKHNVTCPILGVAAALAACAREAKLEEAKWRNNHWPPLGAIRTVESLQRWIQDRVEENMQRVAALERAVGEKGAERG